MRILGVAGHLIVPSALMGLDRLHPLGGQILVVFLRFCARLRDAQRLGDVALQENADVRQLIQPEKFPCAGSSAR
jgi:hypothetical protein